MKHNPLNELRDFGHLHSLTHLEVDRRLLPPHLAALEQGERGGAYFADDVVEYFATGVVPDSDTRDSATANGDEATDALERAPPPRTARRVSSETRYLTARKPRHVDEKRARDDNFEM